MSPRAATAEAAAPGALVSQLVEKTILRGVKGVEYIASPAPAMGRTPKDVILKRGTLNLYHYRPMVEEVYRTPILLVMATTNRGYVLDLAPGQSLVEFLLKRGYDVFMMDWSPPGDSERHLRLEDYVLDFIPECLRLTRERTGEAETTLVGYCFGGVLSTLYAALNPDGPWRNLAVFTTPIDFSKMELFHAWSDPRHFDVDRLVDALGNVPSDMILSAFEMLRPASRVAGQIQLWRNMWDDEFVRAFRMFDRWGTDSLPLAGEYFRQTVKDLVWGDKLNKGELEIGGRRVDLGAIVRPVLHVVAEHDHIVPYEAARPLIERVGSQDKQELLLKGGHISVVAGANAVRRLWPKLDGWLSERSA